MPGQLWLNADRHYLLPSNVVWSLGAAFCESMAFGTLVRHMSIMFFFKDCVRYPGFLNKREKDSLDNAW
jgi:hypothetical protein